MKALTAIVAGSRHDKDICVRTFRDGVFEKVMSVTRCRELSSTDVDNIRTFLQCEKDGTREIDLRTGGK